MKMSHLFLVIAAVSSLFLITEAYTSHGRKYCTQTEDYNYAGKDKINQILKRKETYKNKCQKPSANKDCAQGLVMLPAEGSVFPCCGYITNWSFGAYGTGKLWFVVFRPTNPLLNQFTVVAVDGPHIVTSNQNCGNKKIYRNNIAVINPAIKVMPGDFLGWRAEATDYNCGPMLGFDWRDVTDGKNGEELADYRGFHFGSMTAVGSDPFGLTAGATVDADTLGAGASITALTWDKQYAWALRADVEQGAPPVAQATSAGYTDAAPNLIYTDTTTVTITTVFTVGTDLFTDITLTDADSATPRSDSTETMKIWIYSSPYTSLFELYEKTAGKWAIRVRDEDGGSQDPISYHLTGITYTLTVGAYDSCGLDSTNDPTFSVTVAEVSQAPVFTYPAPGCGAACPVISLSVRYYKAGDIVAVFKATDANGDAITFGEASQTPSHGLFSVNPITGVITMTTTPLLTPPAATSYTIAATVSDSTGLSGLNSELITFNFVDANQAPAFANLAVGTNTVVNVREDEDAQLLLFSAIAIDPDTTAWGDQVTYSWDAAGFQPSSSPLSGAFFTEKGNVWLKNGAVSLYGMDFESGVNVFTISVSASDGLVGGLTPTFTVTIQVVNVNEPPAWDASVSYTRTITEGNKPQEVMRMDPYSSDPDFGDVKFYSLATVWPFFQINYLSGAITTLSGYDINIDSDEIPELLSVGVIVRDSGGLSALQLVSVAVRDINDNAPKFLGNSSYTLRPASRGIGQLLTQVWVDDLDAGENGRVSYRLVGEESFSQAGSYLTVTTAADGSLLIRAKKYLDFDWDIYESSLQKSLIFTVLAIDNGAPPLTSSAEFTLDLSALPCDLCTNATTTTTTTTSTTPTPTTATTTTAVSLNATLVPPTKICGCPFCCDIQRVLLGVSSVVFLAIVGGVTYVMWAMLMEKPKNSRQIFRGILM